MPHTQVVTGGDHFASYLRDAGCVRFHVVTAGGDVTGHAVSSPGVIDRVVDAGGVQETVGVVSVGSGAIPIGTVTYYVTYDTVQASESGKQDTCHTDGKQILIP